MTRLLRLMMGITVITLLPFVSFSQSLSINTDGSTAAPSALLDVKSTSKGVLVPRMSKTEKNSIASPATGLLVFQSSPDSTGFHYYNGTQWIWLTDGSNADTTAWKITGNSNITSNHFLGTTNDSALRFRINNAPSGTLDSISASAGMGFRSLSNLVAAGRGSTALGYKSLLSNTKGTNNTGVGYQAGYLNDTATNNVSIGFQANYYNHTNNNVAVGSGAATYLDYNNLSSTENTYIGTDAGQGFYLGSKSTALGYRALYNHSGSIIYGNSLGRNTAIGDSAMAFSSGASNVAVGTNALSVSYAGDYNVSIGDSSMGAAYNTSQNVAVGYRTLTKMTASYPNTAVGFSSQDSATIGGANTSVGSYALTKNKQGYNNTAIGNAAMFEAVNNQAANYMFDNTAIGNNTLRFNRYYGQTALGANALTNDTASAYNTALGYYAMNSHLRGSSNTAVGTSALRFDTVGNVNTAMGVNAMMNHKTGDNNVAMGYQSLVNDIDGGANTAIGASAMLNHKTNGVNTAAGFETMYYDTAGSYNAAYGYRALRYTKKGFENTALGVGSIEWTDSSYYNTSVGRGAMFQKGGTYNTTVGYYAAGEGVGTPATNYYTVGTTNIGAFAGYRTKADLNTFVGYAAGSGQGTDTLKGIENTAIGGYTLSLTTSGRSNTTTGLRSLYNNTTGSYNTANGSWAMQNNTTGSYNSVLGEHALTAASTSDENSIIGYRAFAGYTSTGASYNNALGTYAGEAMTSGTQNVLIGSWTFRNHTSGSNNTAVGNYSMGTVGGAGNNNTALGNASLFNTIASNNTGIGYNAGQTNTTGTSNTFLGASTDAAAGNLTNATAIGANTSVGASNSLVLGNGANVGIGTSTPGTRLHIYEPNAANVNLRVASLSSTYEPGLELVKTTTGGSDWKIRVNSGGSLVYARGTDDFATTPTDYYQMSTASFIPTTDATNSLGTSVNRWTTVYATVGTINTSDARDKENIADLNYGLKEIMKLRPVSFNWKNNPQWGKKIGFIAQEVKPILNEVVQVGPLKNKVDAAAKDDKGNAVTADSDKLGIYYSDIIPVTVKAIQEQQKIIEQQQKIIDALVKRVEKLEQK